MSMKTNTADTDLTRPEGRLKAARMAAGYPTATAFAEAHGINPATYLTHERGRDDPGGRGISKDTAERYAAFLVEDGLADVTPDWVRHGAGPAPLSITPSVLDPALGTGGFLPSKADAQTLEDLRLIHRRVRNEIVHGTGGDSAPVLRDVLKSIIAAVDAEIERLKLPLPASKRADLYFAIHDLEVIRIVEEEEERGELAAGSVVDMSRYRQLLRLAS